MSLYVDVLVDLKTVIEEFLKSGDICRLSLTCKRLYQHYKRFLEGCDMFATLLCYGLIKTINM